MDCSKRNQIGLLKRDFLTRKNRPYNAAVSRGILNKCLYGEAPPRGPTPYPFIGTIFYEKGTPFV